MAISSQQAITSKLILQHARRTKTKLPSNISNVLKKIESEVIVLLNNGNSYNVILKKLGDIVTENFDNYVNSVVQASLSEGQLAVNSFTKIVNTEVGTALLSTPIVTKGLITGNEVFGKSSFNSYLGKQSKYFQNRLERMVLTAKSEGMSVPDAMKFISGSNGFANLNKNQINSLTRSALNSASNSSLLNFYEKNSDIISTLVFINTLDRRTSLICMGYTGCSWELETKKIVTGNRDFAQPVLHFGCRSLLAPGLNEEFNSLLPPAKRHTKQGYIDESKDFRDWFASQSKEAQILQLSGGQRVTSRGEMLYERFTNGESLNNLL